MGCLSHFGQAIIQVEADTTGTELNGHDDSASPPLVDSFQVDADHISQFFCGDQFHGSSPSDSSSSSKRYGKHFNRVEGERVNQVLARKLMDELQS